MDKKHDYNTAKIPNNLNIVILNSKKIMEENGHKITKMQVMRFIGNELERKAVIRKDNRGFWMDWRII